MRWLAIGVICLVARQAGAVELRSPGIEPTELQTRMSADQPPLVIDVRSPTEYASGHIPGAVNIPAPTVTKNLDAIRRADEVVLYCNDRRFTALAERLLSKDKVTGFSHLEGGLTAWREQNLPLATAVPE